MSIMAKASAHDEPFEPLKLEPSTSQTLNSIRLPGLYLLSDRCFCHQQ